MSTVAMGCLDLAFEAYEGRGVILREKARLFRASWRADGVQVTARTWARDVDEADAMLAAALPDRRVVWFENDVFR